MDISPDRTEAARLYFDSLWIVFKKHQCVSNLILRIFCFQKLYFHCSSASLQNIFWGAFIPSSLNHHSTEYYWRSRDNWYFILWKYRLWCYKDFSYFLAIKKHHLHQIVYLCSVWVSELKRSHLFPAHSHYMSHKIWSNMITQKNKNTHKQLFFFYIF